MYRIHIKYFAFALAICMLGFSPLRAEDTLRPLPANTMPGIVETQNRDGKLVFVSLEIDGWRDFQVFQDLPLAAIKGDRKDARTIKFGCYPARHRTPCLVDAYLDNEREIWFYRRGPEGIPHTLARLPNRVADDSFWFAPISSIAGDSPLAFAALPLGLDVPAKVWVESREAGKTFHSYELPEKNRLVMVRPSFGGDALSALFLVLSPIGEPYTSPAEGIEILAASSDGFFARYAVPPNCEVLGALSDFVICGENTRGTRNASKLQQYPKVKWIQLPDGTNEDITRDNQSPAFQTVGTSILIRGFTGGVARPFIQDIGDGQAQKALFQEEACIGPQEHVDVFEVSASGSAALLTVSSPLRPTRLILALIEDDRIHICAPTAQLFRENPTVPGGHSSFHLERIHVRAGDDVPVSLVSGAAEGALSGHTLLITYGAAGIALPEDYLGPWLTHWVGRGGKVALIHLPGGGAYGAKWTRRGFGIGNKIEISKMLDQVSAGLIERGDAEDGKVSILTESAGGPLAADAILRNPQRYAVLALRAACIAIEGAARENCASYYDYGNWFNAGDRQLMAAFEPLERIHQSPNFPAIVYGMPETDSRLTLDYQKRMMSDLSEKNIQIFNIPGVDHTDRAKPEVEAEWVRTIAQAAIREETQ